MDRPIRVDIKALTRALEKLTAHARPLRPGRIRGFGTQDFGHFGDGGTLVTESGGGGGGGGWYGGNAGDAPNGGGGGSGYISLFALSGSFPGHTRSGDGLVVIRTA